MHKPQHEATGWLRIAFISRECYTAEKGALVKLCTEQAPIKIKL